MYPEAAVVWNAFETCYYGNCGYACGGSQGCGLSTGSAECDGCMSGWCSGQCTDCTNNSECIDWLMCVQECYEPDCEAACSAQYPQGEQLLYGLVNCLETYCSAECY